MHESYYEILEPNLGNASGTVKNACRPDLHWCFTYYCNDVDLAPFSFRTAFVVYCDFILSRYPQGVDLQCGAKLTEAKNTHVIA